MKSTLSYEYSMLMASMHVSVSKHLLNADFPVVWANAAYYDLPGYTKEEYERQFHNKCSAYYANYPEDWQSIRAVVMEAIRQNAPSYECICRMPRKDGTRAWIRLCGAFTDEILEGEQVVYTVYMDISDLKEAEFQLDAHTKMLRYALQQAERDGMTQLYNKVTTEVLINEKLSNPAGAEDYCALYMIDIDDFKLVNDHMGHNYGDNVLIDAAEVLMSNVRADDIVGRVGGDEFIVFFNNVSSSDWVQRKAEKFCQALNRTYYCDDATITVSASVGVAIAKRSEVHFQWLYEKADIALYQAKQNNKNGYAIFDQSFSSVQEVAAINNQKLLSNEMMDIFLVKDGKLDQAAIEQSVLEALKNQEFEVYLQPQMDFETGELVGAEAFVRWCHPRQGILLPEQLMPTFERLNIVRYIDFFMVEKVCRMLKGWQVQGVPLIPIGINISHFTLLESDFMEKISTICGKYPEIAGLMIMEIGECFGEVKREGIIQVAKELTDQGIDVALDRFGSKYSSIVILTVMDFQMLKIDRVMVNNLPESARCQAVVAYTIGLCQQFGIEVVAMGVETEQQLAVLRKLGCHRAQGYFFDKPLSVPKFTEKYRNSR